MPCDVYDLLWAIYTNGWVLSPRVAMSILVFVLMISPYDGAGIDGFLRVGSGWVGVHVYHIISFCRFLE